MYLRVLKWIYNRWDRFFSRLDDWQLRKWMKLRKYIEDLTYRNR